MDTERSLERRTRTTERATKAGRNIDAIAYARIGNRRASEMDAVASSGTGIATETRPNIPTGVAIT